MKTFFKYLFASILGVFISFLLIFLFFLGIFGAMVSSKDKPVVLKENTIFHLTLDKQIIDRASDNPFDGFSPFAMTPGGKTGLNDILENINKAGKDENIKGIFLDLTFLQAGMATIGEIREALLKFKETGKFIVSYSDTYSQGTYYLATAADKIYLTPTGLMELVGLRSEMIFLKGSLEKLGLEPQIIRHGKFKSAIEPLILEKMSEESRLQVMTYLTSMWDHILLGISEQRNIPVEKLNEMATNLTIRNAEAALNNGLIDGIKYRDEITTELKELTGIEESKDLNVVRLAAYKKVPVKKDFKGIARDKIAVVYATGNIIMGEGGNEIIGSNSTARAIRQARKDSTVKAIVFRVNSGGGSALASEVIWREAVLASKEKPFIASMGDVAASGGYYVLAAADTIVASPNTITGSIGVFGLYINTKKFMNEKLGVTIDVAKTNPSADMGSPFRSLTATERAVAQGMVEEIYTDFVNKVSEGRGMSFEAVDNVGQGRVWSGTNAMEIGLIDVYGGLEKAIEIAAEKAGVENYRILNLPKEKDPFEELVKSLTGETRARILRSTLGASARYYEILEKTLQYQGIQARIPYEIEVY